MLAPGVHTFLRVDCSDKFGQITATVPTKMWFMPALANSRVGSSRGTIPTAVHKRVRPLRELVGDLPNLFARQ